LREEKKGKKRRKEKKKEIWGNENDEFTFKI
jgi:hypothetical protein